MVFIYLVFGVMKKSICLFYVAFFLKSLLFAQVEVKTNVLGVLLDRPYLGVEYIFTEDISIELGAGAIFGKTINGRPQSGSNLLLMGKYYINTRWGWGVDRYMIGLYARPQTVLIKGHPNDNFDNANRLTGIGTGFICGRKWANETISFEVNIGLGKLFGERVYLYPNPTNVILADINVDLIVNVNVGYRFSSD